MSAFDPIRDGVGSDRSQFLRDLCMPVSGVNRPGATVSPGMQVQFCLWSNQTGPKGALDCIRGFSATDFTDEWEKVAVPVLVIHRDDDQIVPIDAAARRTVEIAHQATLEVYPGADHGPCASHREQFNADLLAFLAR